MTHKSNHKKLKIEIWDSVTGFQAPYFHNGPTEIYFRSNVSDVVIVEFNDKHTYKMTTDGEIIEKI